MVHLNLAISHIQLIIASISLIIVIIGLCRISISFGRSIGYDAGRSYYSAIVSDHIEARQGELLAKGEQIGYEKGFEAGQAQAKQHLRDGFIMFLEEQIKVLKNQLPSPKSD